MNTMNIEGKVPIAADAAELVIAYLEELNTKLVQAGVKNSYLIVSDVETMIIEALKRQGKSTKLGNEEVLRIINDEFDNPDLIEKYLADMDPEIHEEKVNRFMVDPNQRRLVRRQTGDKIFGNTNETGYTFSNIIRLLIVLIPVFIQIIAVILNLASSNTNNYLWMIESHTLTILGAIIFIGIELSTGLRGEMITNVAQSIKVRYAYRGFFMANILLTWEQYIKLNYEYYFWPDTIIHINSYVASFQSILTTYVILFVLIELMILIRDHVPKFYPLEPEFKLIIRLLTPRYLLAGFGLLIFLLKPTDWDNVIWGSILVMVGILWATIRNFNVSPRFYVFTISFMLFTTVLLRDDVIYVVAYGVGIYVAYLIIESIIVLRSRRGRSVVSKLKEKYSEYYNK